MLTQVLRRLVGEARSRGFDWQHGVRTCGDVAIDGLTIVGTNSSSAVPYHPSHPKFLFGLFGSQGIDFHRFTFIDLGSGKGRVLLVASEFPFREIIGVEFARELHEVACENIERYHSRSQQCAEIRSVHADAVDFEFPLVPLFLYFFNPFGRPVLTAVLRNLQRSLGIRPRDVILVYLAPFHGDLIESETALRCVDRSRYHNTYRLNT
jgi:hypothetical protein